MSAHTEKTKIKPSVLNIIVFAVVLLAIALFLSNPAKYAQSILTGINLWAVSVLPATFPFLFLTALVTALPPFLALTRKISPFFERLFRVSGAGAGVAVLASLSGYPVGARLFFDLKQSGRIAKNENFRLACLVTTSGPPFLVGTVGALMFGSTKAGWILLLSHLLAVWLVCILLGCFGKKENFATLLPPSNSNPNLLYDTLWNAVVSVLCVGGLIALFYCFGEMLGSLGLFSVFGSNPFAEGVLRGLLEMTTGCNILSKIGTPLALASSCALVTFGGFCVLFQQLAYLTRAEVKMLPFLAVKLFQAALAFSLCLLFCILF